MRNLLIFVLALCSVSAHAVVDSYTTYYHTDLNASPILATDENGAEIWRESFNPYGTRRIDSLKSGENQQWYTGKREDSTGLVYLGARFYDPEIGRFLSVDPVHFVEESPTSFNRYAYGNNSPYSYVDPDGELPILLLIPLVVKGIDYGITAYDTYQAYQEGGVEAAAKEVAISSATSIVPGLKTGKRLLGAVADSQAATKRGRSNSDRLRSAPSDRPEIAAQKQAGHVRDTPQHTNRTSADKPTSTFFGEGSADRLTREAFRRGELVPGRRSVIEHDFGVSVGTGPGGGMQTRVRVHVDGRGRIHGHPSGPERF